MLYKSIILLLVLVTGALGQYTLDNFQYNISTTQSMANGLCSFPFVINAPIKSDSFIYRLYFTAMAGVTMTYQSFVYDDGDFGNWRYYGNVISTETTFNGYNLYTFTLQGNAFVYQNGSNFISPALTCHASPSVFANIELTSSASIIGNSSDMCVFTASFNYYSNGNGQPALSAFAFDNPDVVSYQFTNVDTDYYTVSVTVLSSSYTSNTISTGGIVGNFPDFVCEPRSPYITAFEMVSDSVQYTNNGTCYFSFGMNIESGDLVDPSLFITTGFSSVTVTESESNSDVFVAVATMEFGSNSGLSLIYQGVDYVGGSSTFAFGTCECHSYDVFFNSITVTNDTAVLDSNGICKYEISAVLNSSYVEDVASFVTDYGYLSGSANDQSDFSSTLIITSSGYFSVGFFYSEDSAYPDNILVHCINPTDPYITDLVMNDTLITDNSTSTTCYFSGNITVYYPLNNTAPSTEDLTISSDVASTFLNSVQCNEFYQLSDSNITYSISFNVEVGTYDLNEYEIFFQDDDVPMGGGNTVFQLPSITCTQKATVPPVVTDSSQQQTQNPSSDDGISSSNVLSINIVYISFILFLILIN